MIYTFLWHFYLFAQRQPNKQIGIALLPPLQSKNPALPVE